MCKCNKYTSGVLVEQTPQGWKSETSSPGKSLTVKFKISNFYSLKSTSLKVDTKILKYASVSLSKQGWKCSGWTEGTGKSE